MKNRKKFCYLCDGGMEQGEVCFVLGGRALCSDCAHSITTEGLMHVTGKRDAGTMLTALGFEKSVLF